MKMQKSFLIIDSERLVLRIEKREGIWNFKFDSNKVSQITTPEKILSFILGYESIENPATKEILNWNQIPIEMKSKQQIFLALNCLFKEL